MITVIISVTGRDVDIAGPDFPGVFDVFTSDVWGVFHIAVGSGGSYRADLNART
jgi:hypothetical protein